MEAMGCEKSEFLYPGVNGICEIAEDVQSDGIQRRLVK